MGFAQGLAAGQGQANFWDTQGGGGNPYAAMPGIAQAIQASKPQGRGLSASRVHGNAAAAVLEEKKLDQKQQLIDLQKQKQMNDQLVARQKIRWDADEYASLAPTRERETMKGIRTEYDETMKGIQARADAGAKAAQGLATNEKARADAESQKSFDFAAQSLQGGIGGPMVDWINKNGDPNTNLKSIEFGSRIDPETGQMVQIDKKNPDSVMFETADGKTGYFKTKKEFTTQFAGFMSPKVLAYAKTQAAQQVKARDQTRKDVETALKVTAAGKKGQLDRKSLTKVVNDVTKNYTDAKLTNDGTLGKFAPYLKENYRIQTGRDYEADFGPLGTGVLGDTPETIDKKTGKPVHGKWKDKQGNEVTSFTDKSTETRNATGVTTATQDAGSSEVKKTQGNKEGVKTFKDKGTGHTVTVYPDGRQVEKNASGKVVGDINPRKKGDDAKVNEYLDAESKKKSDAQKEADAASKKAKGLKAGEAKKKKEGRPASTQSLTYTDPKTGEKVKMSLKGDVEKAGAEIQTTKTPQGLQTSGKKTEYIEDDDEDKEEKKEEKKDKKKKKKKKKKSKKSSKS